MPPNWRPGGGRKGGGKDRGKGGGKGGGGDLYFLHPANAFRSFCAVMDKVAGLAF